MNKLFVLLSCICAMCINTNKNECFTPDISINDILKLCNPESSLLFYDKIDELIYNDSIRSVPVLCFSNENKSEYLLAYSFYGDRKNSFARFEIGYIVDCPYLINNVELPLSHFHTGSGVLLNMDFDNVIKLKGNDYEMLSDSIIKYKIDNFESSEFLKLYNMPEYFMEYEFSEDKLRKITFGFEYP